MACPHMLARAAGQRWRKDLIIAPHVHGTYRLSLEACNANLCAKIDAQTAVLRTLPQQILGNGSSFDAYEDGQLLLRTSSGSSVDVSSHFHFSSCCLPDDLSQFGCIHIAAGPHDPSSPAPTLLYTATTSGLSDAAEQKDNGSAAIALAELMQHDCTAKCQGHARRKTRPTEEQHQNMAERSILADVEPSEGSISAKKLPLESSSVKTRPAESDAEDNITADPASLLPEDRDSTTHASLSVFHAQQATGNSAATWNPTNLLPASMKRSQTLVASQVRRLQQVLSEPSIINGMGEYPHLSVRPKDMICDLSTRLKDAGIALRDVRLNGSAASYVIFDCTPVGETKSPQDSYNDTDILFTVDVPYLEATQQFNTIRDLVLYSLIHALTVLTSGALPPSHLTRQGMSAAYVAKMFKVPNRVTQGVKRGDCWSLISFRNEQGRNIELKFVAYMQRQYEFTMDSFQVLLDGGILSSEFSADVADMELPSPVVAESMYGDFKEAALHLQHKLIQIPNPEEVRGGGLLKFCNLLARGYRLPPAMDKSEKMRLQLYMCNRFLLDFGELHEQQATMVNYIRTHMHGDTPTIISYLTHLRSVLWACTSRMDTVQMVDNLLGFYSGKAHGGPQSRWRRSSYQYSRQQTWSSAHDHLSSDSAQNSPRAERTPVETRQRYKRTLHSAVSHQAHHQHQGPARRLSPTEETLAFTSVDPEQNGEVRTDATARSEQQHTLVEPQPATAQPPARTSDGLGRSLSRHDQFMRPTPVTQNVKPLQRAVQGSARALMVSSSGAASVASFSCKGRSRSASPPRHKASTTGSFGLE